MAETRAQTGHLAIAIVFAAHGAVTGSFATRVPWIQDHANLSAGQLGLALAFPALGSLLSMPMAGAVSHRFGARRALISLLPLWTLALMLPGHAPTLLTLCGALLIFGATAGISDVVMNAIGVETEARLGRSIMSGLHGAWSAGALIGSAGGTLAAHMDADARVHHAMASIVLTCVGILAARKTLDVTPAPEAEAPPHFALPPKSALIIGAVALCAVFAEGASLDWSAVYLRDILDASPGLAAATTTAFALTMAIARFAGDAVVDRIGGVRAVRYSGVLATLGGLLVVLAANPALTIAGFGLIGLGIAVVVPLAFAAAARSGSNAAQAIAGVATITYAAGLIAPSAIGGIANATSLTVSFGLVTALAVVLVLGASVMRTNKSSTPKAAGEPATPTASSASDG
ncbi:MFS transporter [Streptomyces boninensis]|uniref:MFS transporter n=1 Tax=Streptomyces boninensis TaxID=2039455 RepID=UPI003B21D0F5